MDKTTVEGRQPMTIERGDRIGTTARLSPGAAAVIRDGDRILLTRRTDNGEWCLPSGGVDPGERPAETAIRETLEETGLTIRITRLLGVFCDPDLVVNYPDGNRAQIYSTCFEAEITAGTPGQSDEVVEFGWFAAPEAAALPILATQQAIIRAAYTRPAEPFFDHPA